MTDEGIHLKNRLSEIVKTCNNNLILEEIEQLNNYLISEEQLNMLLRNEIAELERLTERAMDDVIQMDKLNAKYKNLSIGIIAVEERFRNIKTKCKDFFIELLQGQYQMGV